MSRLRRGLEALFSVSTDAKVTDQWFEEDQPIDVHPKDPFKRVDLLPSTRHIRITVASPSDPSKDITLAESSHSIHLHETSLPCRYYLPITAVDQSLLRHSGTTTKCPYKGEAEYYSVEVGGKVYEDVVWYYNRPLLECAKVEGLVCFYNEKVDIELDGEKLEKPISPFANRKPGEKPNLD